MQPRTGGSIPSGHDIFVHNVQTGFGFQQASYPSPTGALSVGVERPGLNLNFTSSFPEVNKCMEPYLYSLMCFHVAVLNSGQWTLAFFNFKIRVGGGAVG